MSRNILSKSSFIRGTQCYKSLYLYKNRYFLRDPLPPEQLATFKRGTNIGILARQLFPGGIDCSPPTPFQYSHSVMQTTALIERNAPVIYEAAFNHDRVLIATDILVQRDNRWHAYEVKSSVSVSETYLLDAALQYYVIIGSGLEVASFSIITMNNNYIKSGDIDLNQLFKIEDVTEYAKNKLEYIRKEIQEQLKIAQLPGAPVIEPGLHCHNPYFCDFYGHCHKKFPANSVLNWQWLKIEERYDLVRRKMLVAESIPETHFDDPVKRRKLHAHKQNQQIIDFEKGQELLGQPVFPLVFCKAYYSHPAVPVIDGTSPYSPIPIQSSVAEMSNGINSEFKITHYHFGFFEPKEKISEIIKHILDKAANTIYIYNDLNLMHLFEESQASDSNPKKNSIIDLSVLILQGCYYHPSTNGEIDLMQWRNVFQKVQPDTPEVFSKDRYAAIEHANITNDETDFQYYRAKAEKSAAYHLQMMQALFKLFR